MKSVYVKASQENPFVETNLKGSILLSSDSENLTSNRDLLSACLPETDGIDSIGDRFRDKRVSRDVGAEDYGDIYRFDGRGMIERE